MTRAAIRAARRNTRRRPRSARGPRASTPSATIPTATISAATFGCPNTEAAPSIVGSLAKMRDGSHEGAFRDTQSRHAYSPCRSQPATGQASRSGAGTGPRPRAASTVGRHPHQSMRWCWQMPTSAVTRPANAERIRTQEDPSRCPYHRASERGCRERDQREVAKPLDREHGGRGEARGDDGRRKERQESELRSVTIDPGTHPAGPGDGQEARHGDPERHPLGRGERVASHPVVDEREEGEERARPRRTPADRPPDPSASRMGKNARPLSSFATSMTRSYEKCISPDAPIDVGRGRFRMMPLKRYVVGRIERPGLPRVAANPRLGGCDRSGCTDPERPPLPRKIKRAFSPKPVHQRIYG